MKNFILAFTLMALTASAQTVMPLTSSPLYFEAHRGQANGSVQFMARGHGYQFLISPTEAQLVLRKVTPATLPMPFRRTKLTSPGRISTCVLQMQLVGANAQAQVSGEEELAGKINYFIGSDSSQWQTDVPIFAKTCVEQLYPGVNLVYYGNQQRLEYDFTVAPKADFRKIAIHFDGVDKISIDTQGELILKLGSDEIHQLAPEIYQMQGGSRKEVSGGYRLLDARTMVFAIDKYNHDLPLIIDPILSYSTYLGGNGSDTGFAVKVDTNGFIYVAGETLSTQLPVTPGAFQKKFGGGSLTGDAFIAKFDNTGSNLVYFTYLGGSADDGALDMAIDSSGDAYLTGFTQSPNFPVFHGIFTNISGPFDGPAGAYRADGFVTELNTNGSALIYSTYLGGNNNDAAYGIAVDSSNNTYVTGYTTSTNFPTTNAVQTYLAGTQNAFVTKFAPSGTAVIYSTYLGGTNADTGEGIAADALGNAYVTGYTDSTNFPATNAFQGLLNGITNIAVPPPYDAFVTKFNASGSLSYSTFLGGTNSDFGLRIAVDVSGNVYVVGTSQSPDYPDTANNVIGLSNGVTNNTASLIFVYNAFLTKLDFTGTNLIYSAVFGGTNTDVAEDVAIDPAGNAFVIGSTTATNFPTFNTSGFLSPTNSGGTNVFVIAFNADCSALLYSAYLGGSGADLGYGIAVDTAGNAYITGQASSVNFPTLNAFQTSLNGGSDSFLAKILPALPSPVLTITLSDTNNLTISWPAVLPFEPELGQLFTLEFKPDLTSTNGWEQTGLSQTLTNGLYIYNFQINPIYTNAFFRLSSQ
ncbi:MAG: SBBP repeat-containing protein [Verrucomicrobiota bacterium]